MEGDARLQSSGLGHRSAALTAAPQRALDKAPRRPPQGLAHCSGSLCSEP